MHHKITMSLVLVILMLIIYVQIMKDHSLYKIVEMLEREVSAPSRSYRELNYFLFDTQDGYCSDYNDYPSPFPSYANKNASCSFKFDMSHINQKKNNVSNIKVLKQCFNISLIR